MRIGRFQIKAFVLLVLLFTVVFFVAVSQSTGSTQGVPEPTMLSRALPSGTCLGSTNNCHLSSPTLVDFDGDGILDILLATNNGHVMVIKDDGTSDGAVLLNRDIADFIPNMSANTEVIASSPAVGDIDQDGKLEIVVGFGSIYSFHDTRGGMIVLEYDGSNSGNLENGWPQFSMATYSNGLEKTIFSSPAIGDLDNDGDLEIVAGGFDKRLYAWHHNGQLVNGFPPDSYLRGRFPTWTDLIGKLSDNVWSSPALADMDGDGYLDIILGTDEGNFDDRYSGDSGGWVCPYELPAGWAPGYCGGSVYVVNRFGKVLPGFPQYRLETFQSVPAIGDINEDGSLDIVIGTGRFYYDSSPDKPTAGFKVFAWDNKGNDLPGWEGGKDVGGTVPASPSIGDIAGDRRPEIIVLANDMKLYAWHHDGTPVTGFPMTPLDNSGQPRDAAGGIGFLLADYDSASNGKMEIIFKQAWAITIVDGTGQQLTTSSNKTEDSLPMYRSGGTIFNNPAIGDIDGNGTLDLIVQNSELLVWEFPGSTYNTDWPIFKQDVARISNGAWPMLDVNPGNIAVMHRAADYDTNLNLNIRNTGSGSFAWTAAATHPQVSISPISGMVLDEDTATVTIPTGALAKGAYSFGSIAVTGPTGDDAVAGSPRSVSIMAYIVDEIYNVYLPTIQK